MFVFIPFHVILCSFPVKQFLYFRYPFCLENVKFFIISDKSKKALIEKQFAQPITA